MGLHNGKQDCGAEAQQSTTESQSFEPIAIVGMGKYLR